MRSFLVTVVVGVLLATLVPLHAGPQQSLDVRADARSARSPHAEVAEFFTSDPTVDPYAVVAGDALDRLTWRHDAPAFRGDRPGSLSALYDATLPAGLFGFALPVPYTQDDTFTAAAVFVIDPEGYAADPNGFFQLSWGLWSSATTGLERTGNFDSFAADSFELLEFDYFPNVSDFFGGPYLSPTAFGVEPPSSDAFANAAFSFGVEVALPLGEPLLAVLEHRPDVNAMTATIYRVVGARQVLPLPGAVALVGLDQMPERAYRLDTVGLTLWQDGFSGDEPSVRATLVYHSILAAPELFDRPADLLRVPPRKRRP